MTLYTDWYVVQVVSLCFDDGLPLPHMEALHNKILHRIVKVQRLDGATAELYCRRRNRVVADVCDCCNFKNIKAMVVGSGAMARAFEATSRYSSLSAPGCVNGSVGRDHEGFAMDC